MPSEEPSTYRRVVWGIARWLGGSIFVFYPVGMFMGEGFTFSELSGSIGLITAIVVLGWANSREWDRWSATRSGLSVLGAILIIGVMLVAGVAWLLGSPDVSRTTVVGAGSVIGVALFATMFWLGLAGRRSSTSKDTGK